MSSLSRKGIFILKSGKWLSVRGAQDLRTSSINARRSSQIRRFGDLGKVEIN
jgi:hypothetical protein